MRSIRTLLLCGLALAVTQGVRADELVWAMSNGGDGNLWRIDVPSDSTSLIGALKDPVLGDVGPGWSTVAETPDKNLYFLRRFQNDVHVFKLDSTNIQVSGGVVQNLVSLGSTGLGGNLDGLTAGPDGNIYLTAYQNTIGPSAVNGLFRFHPGTGITDFVGTFGGDAGPGGTNSFYTDLAFDPITGDLFGTGFDPNGQFSIYRLNGASVLTGSNQTFTFNKAFAAAGFDGLAFNRLTGAMYESSDTGGVFEVDRNTGTFIKFIGKTGGTGIGTDLAVQADTIPNGVPEPGALALLGGMLVSGSVWVRRRRR